MTTTTTKKKAPQKGLLVLVLLLLVVVPFGKAFHLKQHVSLARKTRHWVSKTSEAKTHFIRKALFADLSTAANVLTHGFYPGVNPFVFFWERLQTVLSLEETFPRPDTQHEFFVACNSGDGRVVGMVEIDNRANLERRPYMCNLAVDPKRRNQGLAQELISLSEDYAVEEWGAKEMFLKVRESNAAAFSLYKKLGYEQISEDQDQKGKLLFVMTKELVTEPEPQPVQEEPALVTADISNGRSNS